MKYSWVTENYKNGWYPIAISLTRAKSREIAKTLHAAFGDKYRTVRYMPAEAVKQPLKALLMDLAREMGQ